MDEIPPTEFDLLPVSNLNVTDAVLDEELTHFDGAAALWLGDTRRRSYVVEIPARQKIPKNTLAGEEQPPLVMVHGLGDAGMRDFYPVLETLSETRDLVLIDLPGLGRSEVPDDTALTPVYFARRVAQVIQARIDGPFDLLGHSLGGNVCLTLASHSALSLRRLVIVDAAGVLHREAFVKKQVDAGAAPLSKLHKGLGGLVKGVGKTLVEVTGVVEPSDARLAGGSEKLSTPGARAATALILHRIGAYLPAITAPTLLVWGENDAVAPLRTGLLLWDRIAAARLSVLADVGHVPMTDAPEEMVKRVSRFLDSAPTIPFLPKTAPGQSSKTVNCKGRGEAHITENSTSLHIISCPSILIENASFKQLRIENSTVEMTGITVTGGTTVRNSRIVITGGRLSGDIGLYIDNVTADIAGSFIDGRTHAVAAKTSSRLLFSAVVIHSAHYHGAVHERVALAAKQAL